ncbi:hypothetical protein Y032_0170g245 [Ancylostoma ceylanicum]|uniref:Uncharacterized protein n=1 Tax=Ancylostoma ceylanicum TaxID=53326 RepID=A0A016SVM1_9BILA|nr:hypothetical protein Y032_0170g245 [Ancylostoma ceylanicum]
MQRSHHHNHYLPLCTYCALARRPAFAMAVTDSKPLSGVIMFSRSYRTAKQNPKSRCPLQQQDRSKRKVIDSVFGRG